MAIVKILARHRPSYASLIQYILNEEKVDKEYIYTNNLLSNTIPGYVHEFMENEAFRKQTRSDQIYLYQEILSFHADENSTAITKEKIDDLVTEYIRLRGNTGVIIGAVHRKDAKHIHVHFCVSALHFRTGKSFGLNKMQLQELKQAFQHYHKDKYPELTKSFPKHGKGERYKNHSQWHAQQREHIVGRVQQSFDQAKSQKEFVELLREKDLHYYERNGKATGIEYDGLKFRFSRLLADRQFDSLPVERSDEDRALDEIQAIKERRQGREGRNRNVEDKER
jgi:hypothetical protein